MLGFKKRPPLSLSLHELPSSDATPDKPLVKQKDAPKRSVGWTLVPPDAASFKEVASPSIDEASRGVAHPESWTAPPHVPLQLPETTAAVGISGTTTAETATEDAVGAEPDPPIASALTMEKPVAEAPSGAIRSLRFDGLAEVPEVFVDPSLLNLVRGVKLPQDESSPVSVAPDLSASEPASSLSLETELQSRAAEPSQPPSFKLSFKFNQVKPPTETSGPAATVSTDAAAPQAEPSRRTTQEQTASAAEHAGEVVAEAGPSMTATPPAAGSNKTAPLSLTERFIRVAREAKPNSPPDPAVTPATPTPEQSSPLPTPVERSSEVTQQADSVGDVKPQPVPPTESLRSNNLAEPAPPRLVGVAQPIAPVQPEQPVGSATPATVLAQVEEPPPSSANVPEDTATAPPRLSKRAMFEKTIVEEKEPPASSSAEPPGRTTPTPPSPEPASETHEYEIVLGARQIAALAFLFVVCLVIFSSVAYLTGEASARKKMAAVAPSQIVPQPVLPLVAPATAQTQDAPQVLVESNAPEVTASDIAPVGANQTPRLDAPTPYTVNSEPAKEASSAPIASGRPIFGTPEIGKLYLQMGAVDRSMAIVFVQGLRSRNLEAFVAPGPSPQIFRVLIGPFATQAAYLSAKTALDNMELSTPARRYEEGLPRQQTPKHP